MAEAVEEADGAEAKGKEAGFKEVWAQIWLKMEKKSEN